MRRSRCRRRRSGYRLWLRRGISWRLEYARARIQMRGPHDAGCYQTKIIANGIGRFAENGQAGPCLTDAARSAALDAPFAKLPLRRDPNAPAAVIAAQIARGHNKPPVHQNASAPDILELGKCEANCQDAS